MSRLARLWLPFMLIEIASATIAANGQVTDPPRKRHEFAKAMGQVKEGMSKAEVLALLGHPDDIRTERDPGGISTVGTQAIWRYGTSGHLTTATLGQVYIDKNDRVQYVFGKGTPPPEGMFEEHDLSILLDALGQVPSYNAAWHYNPRRVIRAVNLLQPLGKEKALAAIDEFLRVASDWDDEGREGVFLVLRTLFDVPNNPGHMPPMFVGAPIPSEPKDPTLLSRFPIAIVGDIPFLLVEGYNLGGFPEQPESHVEYFRKNGRVRDKPLTPSDDPFSELDKFAKSPRWIYTGANGFHDDQRGRQFLGQQLLRLMDTVYRVEPGVTAELLPLGDKKAEARKKIVQEASNLKIHWDPSAQRYTFADGTLLPEREPKHYRREIWRPTVAGLDIEIIMERDGPRYVSVWVAENYERGRDAPAAVFKVFNINAKDKVLVEFTAGGGRGGLHKDAPKELPKGATGTRSTWKPIRLNEGGEVRVQLVVGGNAQLSPTFKP